MKKIDENELREIFKAIKKNQQKAFDKLYSKYNKLIYGIAFSILKHREDAEEIVQTVFLKLYKMDKSKLPSSKEATWIYALTKNETITLLRNKKNNNINLENIYQIEDRNNEINNIIDKVEFNKIISKLNNKEKEIISLKIISNLSFEEIGKLLDEPTGTIKWRYYKSIHTLKLLLSNLGMFIITFIIGLNTLINKQRIEKQPISQETTQPQDKNQNQNQDEEQKKEQENKKEEDVKTETTQNKSPIIEENTNIQEEKKQNEIKQEIIIKEDVEEQRINNFGIGVLTISSIFLIFTIIFTINLIKYQLNLNKKTSK